MRIAYLFNNNKQFDGALILREEVLDSETGTVLIEAEAYPENSTDIVPEEGLQNPPKFDETNKIWVGATDEEHEEWSKVNPTENGDNLNAPSETDQAIAQLTFNQATQKVEQDKFNANVLLQIAQMGGTK